MQTHRTVTLMMNKLFHFTCCIFTNYENITNKLIFLIYIQYIKMHVLILSGANVVAGSNNTIYKYQFPQSIQLDKYASIALLKLDIYYCWFNISASLYNNHQFSYKWFNSSESLATTHTVTLADEITQYQTLIKLFNLHFLQIIIILKMQMVTQCIIYHLIQMLLYMLFKCIVIHYQQLYQQDI